MNYIAYNQNIDNYDIAKKKIVDLISNQLLPESGKLLYHFKEEIYDNVDELINLFFKMDKEKGTDKTEDELNEYMQIRLNDIIGLKKVLKRTFFIFTK